MDLLRMWSNKNVGVNILWSCGSSHPTWNPAGEEQSLSSGWAPGGSQDVQTEGQARGWGARWPPVFPLSFSIMLIWLLLVTAMPHYYYSLQALNHSDGYNLASTNLPNSSPLHFFNTKDNVGRFSNWLCNFLFSSPPISVGECRKGFLWRAVGWRNPRVSPCVASSKLSMTMALPRPWLSAPRAGCWAATHYFVCD